MTAIDDGVVRGTFVRHHILFYRRLVEEAVEQLARIIRYERDLGSHDPSYVLEAESLLREVQAYGRTHARCVLGISKISHLQLIEMAHDLSIRLNDFGARYIARLRAL